jgi:hypothetical protein
LNTEIISSSSYYKHSYSRINQEREYESPELNWFVESIEALGSLGESRNNYPDTTGNYSNESSHSTDDETKSVLGVATEIGNKPRRHTIATDITVDFCCVASDYPKRIHYGLYNKEFIDITDIINEFILDPSGAMIHGVPLRPYADKPVYLPLSPSEES